MDAFIFTKMFIEPPLCRSFATMFLVCQLHPLQNLVFCWDYLPLLSRSHVHVLKNLIFCLPLICIKFYTLFKIPKTCRAFRNLFWTFAAAPPSFAISEITPTSSSWTTYLVDWSIVHVFQVLNLIYVRVPIWCHCIRWLIMILWFKIDA